MKNSTSVFSTSVFSTSVLARLVAAYLVLLGAAAVTAVRAEEGPPVATPGAKSGFGAAGDTGAAGTEGGNIDRHAGDKGDNQGASAGEHQGATDSQGAEETDSSKGARHGEESSAFKHSEIESSPIDTRITVVSKPRWAHARKTHDFKNTKIGRKLWHSPLAFAQTRDRVLRNAIGLRVHNTHADFKGAGTKHLEGSAGAQANGGGGDAASDLHDRGFVPLTTIGSGISHDPRLNGSMNSQIDGRDLVRASLRTGAIGGATKNFAGVINGTNFHPRHP